MSRLLSDIGTSRLVSVWVDSLIPAVQPSKPIV